MAAPENPFAVRAQNPELIYGRGMYNNAADYLNKARLASFGAKGELSEDLEGLQPSDFEYSPEAQAYLNRVDEYLSKTQGGPYEVSPYGFSVTDPQTGATRPLTNEEVMALAAKPDFENQFAASFADPTGEKAWDIGRFAVRPDQDVRLIDRTTGEVIASGKGYEGGSLAAKAAAGIFGAKGKKADFIVQGAQPGGDWTTITEHKPEKSGFGTFLDIALPMVIAPFAAPAIGGALGSSALGAGLASAGATALSGTLQGKSIGDIAKSSIVSGLTAGALDATGAGKFLAGPGGGSPAANAATKAAEKAAEAAAGDIIVTGIRSAAPAAITGALSSAPSIARTAAQKYSDPSRQPNLIDTTYTPTLDETVVTGVRGTSNLPFVAPTNKLFNPAQYQGGENVRDTQPAEEEKKFADNEEIIVTGNRGINPVYPVGSIAGSAANFVADNYGTYKPEDQVIKQNEETGESDIVVTAPKNTVLPNMAGVVATTTFPELYQDPTKVPEQQKSTIDKAIDYAKLAGLGLGLAGNIFGGGKSGAGSGRYFSGSKGLSSTFTDKLPTPGQNGAFTVGGLGGTAADRTFAARPVTDWYRYGMGSAMDIPEGADLSRATSPYAGYGPGTLGEETFRAVSGASEEPTGMYAGGSMGYSRGSSRESFAVEGPGTGRSDDIPAVLSDGEYVIDAETVALLGDGSSKAGAKKLDELRVKVRKHKGKNLAKGKFSVNARSPEKYMSGGRI